MTPVAPTTTSSFTRATAANATARATTAPATRTTTTPAFPIPASEKVAPAHATTPTATTTATATNPLTTTTTRITTKPLTATRPLTTTIPTTRTVRPARPTHGSTHLSGEAIALAAIGVLLLLACAAWAFARWRAYEPHWLVSLRHATAEAGFRMSATWAEFTDWIRLGH